ncbi:MAG TPA: flavodoxin family protein [Firmicutes bacterium]|nr:flavodoxin family protein [Candidatus Fermentithermobacillaceae bacterium]
MKILAISGSPRPNGNTASLMEVVLESAKRTNPNTEVVEYNMHRLNCKGCQGCLACKKPEVETCVQNDELSPILKEMLEADAWILGTPVYMGHTSAQLKLLLDRMYCFTGPNRTVRIPKGKKCIFVITQGAAGDRHKDIIDLFSRFMAWRGVSTKFVRAVGLTLSPGFTQETLEEANALGKWVIRQE